MYVILINNNMYNLDINSIIHKTIYKKHKVFILYRKENFSFERI